MIEPNELAEIRRCCRDEAAYQRILEIIGDKTRAKERSLLRPSIYGRTPETSSSSPRRSPPGLDSSAMEGEGRTGLAQCTSILLEEVFEGATDLIHAVGSDGRFLWANGAWKEALGYEISEHNQLNLLDILHKKSRPQLESILNALRIAGGSKKFQGKLITRSGKEIQVEGILTCRLVDGQAEAMIGVLHDVTSRRLVEEELRLHAQIIDQIHDSVIATDADGIITSWNRGAELLFGYVAKEVIGKPITALYPANQHHSLTTEILTPLGKAGTLEIEVQMRRKTGEVFYAHLAMSMVWDSEHKPMGMISYVVDRSALKRAEFKLHRYHRLTESISRAQARYIADTELPAAIETLLRDVLSLTDSSHGFIGEVCVDSEGSDSVTTLAVASSKASTEGDGGCGKFDPRSDEFRAPDLLARVMKERRPVIGVWPGRKETGKGVSTLRGFLALPVKSGEALVGVVGIANRPRGYDQEVVDYLAPLLATVANFIVATRTTRERNRAEREMAERETRLRTIFNNVVDGIVTISENGVVESFNPAAEKLFAYEAAEVVGNKVEMLMPPLYRKNHELGLIEYLETGTAKVIGQGRIVQAIRKNGETFPVDLAVSEMRLGDRRMFTGIIRDITERLQAEEALKESERKLTQFLDAVPVGVYVIDKEGKAQYANEKARNLLGVGKPGTKSNDQGQHADSLYISNSYELYPQERVPINRALKGDRSWVEDVEVHHMGVATPLEISASPIYDVNGDVAYAIAAYADISERKRVEKLKREFISTVSHELRTPLTSIRGSLGLINGGATGELPVAAQKMIDIAYRNSERLIRLINDILDMEKIESGKLEFQLHARELLPIIEQAVEANQAYAAEYGVRYRIHSEQSGVMVRVDSDRLLQVLTNLLSNAAKFSPRGEVVGIDVRRIAGNIRVSVNDQGPGIPPEFREKIFEKFSQADSSDSRQRGGSGLGLSISKAIIERMGGTIALDWERPKGSSIYFELPEEGLSLFSDRDERLARIVEAGRILICEDDPDVAAMLRAYLERNGYSADVAPGTSSAAALLARNAYQALTLDLKLPSEDRRAFIRQLYENEELSEIPIILVSATAGDGRRELNGDAVGLIHWVGKPIDQVRLKETVRQATGPRGQRRARILHVEDDPELRQVVAAILGDVAQVVAAVTLADARSKLATFHFDLVILDLVLPDGMGSDLLSLLKTPPHQKAPVVIFSAIEADARVVEEVAAALTKSRTSNDDLLDTIRALIRRPTTPTKNPAPGNPAPGNPAPGNPAPENPTPGNPAPGNPAPENPAPGNPTPGNPAPGNPAPENPTPGNPAPGNPAPGNAAPENPAPGNPAPGNPTQSRLSEGR